MAQQLFIPHASEAAQEVLGDIGYVVIPFTDVNTEGLLTGTPVDDVGYVAPAFDQISSLNLIPDLTPPEFQGLARVPALADEELKRFEFERSAAAILHSNDSAHPNIGDTSQVLTQYRDSIRNLALLHGNLQEGHDPHVELRRKIDQEFLAIVDHEKVRDVTLSQDGTSFAIRTSELRCRHPRGGALHSIGEFEITFLMNPQTSGAVRWVNLTREVKYTSFQFYSPHISKRGSPCLGNLTGVCEKLIKAGDYFAAVDMAIRFVESVRDGSMYLGILSRFPLAKGS